MIKLRFARQAAAVGVLGVLGVGATGCEELLTESPPHMLVADNLFTSPAGFRNAVNALYVTASYETAGLNGFQNDHRFFFWTLGVDNAFGGWLNDAVGLATANWEGGSHPMLPVNRQLDMMWAWLYEAVNGANTIIGRSDNPNLGWSEPERNLILAEARFIRAWAYRHLSYLWGDVPLNLEESRSVRTDWQRAPLAEVLQQIEQDLLFAEQHLPDVTPSASRASRALARHYLAELYLRTGQDALAEQKALEVINSGHYSLITSRYGVRANEPGVPFTDQFLDGNVLRSQGNTEALWVFEFEQHVPGGRQESLRRAWAPQYFRLEGIPITAEHGGRGQQRGNPTNFAWSLYEPQDDRFSIHAVRKFYIYSDPDLLPEGQQLGDTLWLTIEPERTDDPGRLSTRKWDWMDPANPTGSASYQDIAAVRLAETYLLAAEAQLKQGKLGDAAESINALRRRANASLIGPGDVTADFILDERSRELLTEEQRRYSLLRTGRWLERTRAYNPQSGPNIREHHTLLPIPQPVIDSNLTAPFPQNPGY